MIRWMLLPAMLGAALGLTWLPAAAQTSGSAKVTVEDSEQYGEYLTDADGQALYLFTADKQGAGESSCYDDCAAAWPPLLTEGEPEAGEQADPALLDTFERQDGATQVTYNGWPLYYYVQDQGAGEATGQDVHGFGGEWYLVTPQGNPVEEAS